MYAKIFSQIYDGSLASGGRWQALVLFQQMLVLADQDGNVDMTLAAIARRTTIPVEILQVGLEELLLPDPESRTPDEDGRRIVPLSVGRSWGWRIVNYLKYRNMKRETDRKQYHRDYWHKRQAEPLNTNSTPTQQTQHPLNTTQPDSTNQPIAEAEAYTKAVDQERLARAPKKSRPNLQPEDVSDEVWEAFVELRKMKKSPINSVVIKMFRTEAAKAGMTLEQAVSESVSRGWQGFKAGWVEKEKQKNHLREVDSAEMFEDDMPEWLK